MLLWRKKEKKEQSVGNVPRPSEAELERAVLNYVLRKGMVYHDELNKIFEKGGIIARRLEEKGYLETGMSDDKSGANRYYRPRGV